MGIHTIQGSLIADVSMMDSPRWGIGWCWDDDEYNPPLFPLLVNGRDKFMQVFQSKLREAHIKPPVLVVRGRRLLLLSSCVCAVTAWRRFCSL